MLSPEAQQSFIGNYFKSTKCRNVLFEMVKPKLYIYVDLHIFPSQHSGHKLLRFIAAMKC